jgi:hypothetical protein
MEAVGVDAALVEGVALGVPVPVGEPVGVPDPVALALRDFEGELLAVLLGLLPLLSVAV